jgi:TetR/AcrR family transcriptional regulator
MFEGLIDFIEDTLFSRISKIIKQEPTAILRCEKMLTLLLAFAERNPGITCVLAGSALVGEDARLHQRVAQLFDRYETQLRQVIRDAEVQEGLRPVLSLHGTANLLLATAEGRIAQFVRSGFKRPPTADWSQQWQYIAAGLFKQTAIVQH